MAQATDCLARLLGSNFLKLNQHPPNTVPTPGHSKSLTQTKDGLARHLLSRPNYCPSLPLRLATDESHP